MAGIMAGLVSGSVLPLMTWALYLSAQPLSAVPLWSHDGSRRLDPSDRICSRKIEGTGRRESSPET